MRIGHHPPGKISIGFAYDFSEKVPPALLVGLDFVSLCSSPTPTITCGTLDQAGRLKA